MDEREKVEVDKRRGEIKIRINPKIYDYAYVKATMKMVNELFDTKAKKNKNEINVFLKSKKLVKDSDLSEAGYEFFNLLLGITKQMKTS